MNKAPLITLISLFISCQIIAQNEIPQFHLYKLGTKTNEPTVAKVMPGDMLSTARPTLIIFSMAFFGCPPCVQEIDTLYKKLKPLIDKGDLHFVVVVSRNDSSVSDGVFLASYATEKKWPFPVYMDLKTSLTDVLNVGGGFPRNTIFDKAYGLRYMGKPGKSDAEEIATIRDITTQLKTLIPPKEVTRFTAAELSNMVSHWEQYSSGTTPAKFLQGKGLIKAGNDNFTQFTVAGDGLFLLWHTPDYDGDNCKLILRFSKKDDFLSYQENFVRDGFKLTVSDSNKNEKVLQKNGTTITMDETDITLSVAETTDASFPGGEAAWKKYLNDYLQYNIPLKRGAPEGSYEVIVSFMIDTDGSPRMAYCTTKHGYGMEQEAIRVVEAGPKWNPATKNGSPTPSYKKQSLYFIIESE